MIRVPYVRVINTEGEPLGILPIAEALDKAVLAGLDLVEIAPKAEPPVCKIMDFGKFKYEKSKKEKEAKKKQHVMHLKEIKFHPQTESHDFNFKVEHGRKFILKGDRVKMTVVFRGREIAYKDFGRQLLERINESLADIAVGETLYKLEGKNMISTYIPDKNKIQVYKRKVEKEQREAQQRLLAMQKATVGVEQGSQPVSEEPLPLTVQTDSEQPEVVIEAPQQHAE
ncbi:MAG: translation initiation factor IF-3 [Chitinivibrionales bacterium]|nr:translation initiation factor IF-3 [Chitinivibrionales bacterium]